MSTECKNRFEVQKIIRSCILQGLTWAKLQPSESSTTRKWDCMEYGQASFDNADKIVLMNLLFVERPSWQGQSYDGSANRIDDWAELQSWQFQILLKRKSKSSMTDILAEDAASLLISWFNGAGSDYLRERGLSNLLIDASQVFVYNDDSTVYQKRAVFTVKILVPKALRTGLAGLDVVKPDICPI